MEVCSPWIDPSDLCCEGGGTVTDCNGVATPLTYKWTDLDYALAASNILYARTCYQFPGICTSSIWPCIDSCKDSCYPCVKCCSPSVIELPSDYDVISVDSVTEDGVVLNPASYRLERGKFLVRIDGLKWQKNSFGLPDCGGVETIVQYTHGRTPPIELQQAAAELACFLKTACETGKCDLPQTATRRTSRGVEVELLNLVTILREGSTGLSHVDMVLYQYRNCGKDGTIIDPMSFNNGWGNV